MLDTQKIPELVEALQRGFKDVRVLGHKRRPTIIARKYIGGTPAPLFKRTLRPLTTISRDVLACIKEGYLVSPSPDPNRPPFPQKYKVIEWDTRTHRVIRFERAS